MIEIKNLQRAYGDFVAVDNVSFSIQKGEIVGLLGHNGAGKTTIMKMISGYLEPGSGQIYIGDLDMSENRTEIQKKLGYLPEVLPVYPEMSVADYLDYAARLKGLNSQEATTEISRVVRATDISSKLVAPIATLSRGYKQRVGVAQAILGKPKLLILDEPTNGLDPTQTHQMRDLIRQLAQDATVILSTHIMQEVDALCDRVLIMRSGELALDSNLQELRISNRILVNSDIDEADANTLLSSIPGVESLSPEKHFFQVTFNPQSDYQQIASTIATTLIQNNYSLFELKPEHRDLESVFRDVNEQTVQEERHAA